MLVLMFFIGILEMAISTLWTKYVAENKVLAGTTMTMVSVLVWYFMLRVVVEDITNMSIVLSYALGCGFGTMLTLIAPKWFSVTKKSRAKKAKDAVIQPGHATPAMPIIRTYEPR